MSKHEMECLWDCAPFICICPQLRGVARRVRSERAGKDYLRALGDAIDLLRETQGAYPVVHGMPAYMRPACEHDLMDAVHRQCVRMLKDLRREARR